MKNYHKLEQKIIGLFKINQNIIFEGESYLVKLTGKPRPSNNKGECKTDVYIQLENENTLRELKISVKMKDSHEWQESKLTKERAKTIFGEDYSSIISTATKSISEQFKHSPLLFKDRKGNTEQGSVTMGWRLEITHSPRKLSVPLQMESQTILESFYKGTNMEEEKTHAKVCDKIIEDSGVANYMIIITEEELSSYEDVLSRMILIDELEPPLLYLAFIANNYRSMKDKIDGSRSLAVYVLWQIKNGKLSHKLIFDEPLLRKGKELSIEFKKMFSGHKFDIQKIDILQEEILFQKEDRKEIVSTH